MSATRDATAIVFLDGHFIAASRARVSALDRGLLYGDGLFETLRSYRGIPFALDDHIARLRRAGEHIRLRIPHSSAWWRRIISELLRRNHLVSRDAAVRITLTRGAGGEGLIPPRRCQPTLIVTARSLPRDLARRRRNGVAVTLLPFHPGLGGLLRGIKTTAYLTAMLGKIMARERNAFEGIYQTPSGEVLEGTTSNLFLLDGREMATPPVGRGILAGITRQRVLAIARQSAFRVHERIIHARELLGSRAAFLTASTIEVMPIESVDGVHLTRSLLEVAEIQALFAASRDAELALQRRTSAYID